MTIESALQGIYPDQIISEPVRLGTKLSMITDSDSLFGTRVRYDVYRNDGTRIFSFSSNGIVYTCNSVELTSHEKGVITRIISMWREHIRPDWELWAAMRRQSQNDITLVPATYNTL
nr:MAG TPA: hypothetical protein [Caudoviricetes sp.]